MAEVSDVVVTRRVEVVDNGGVVRIVLGVLGEGGGPIFGLMVHDEDGRARAWVFHEGSAAEVGLDFGGDTVAALGVSDTGEPKLFLKDD